MKIKLIAMLMVTCFIGSCESEQKNSNANDTKKNIVTTNGLDSDFKSEAAKVDYSKLDKYLKVLQSNNRMAGSLAIYKNDQLDYKKALIVKGNELVDSEEDYKYKIGSISKTFTSVLVFQLIEEGKLSLETQLATYFPKVKNAEKISIKQLLNHHSGISNYTDTEEFTNYYDKFQTNDKMVARIEQLPVAFEPGEKGEYSNSNFLLLGYIIEKITNKDYGEVIEEKIAKPLNLQSTYLEEITESEKNEVFSYNYNDTWTKFPQWNMSTADAAGALVSTTKDLNVFFKALFDGELLSEESLALMIKEKDNFGHGIFSREFEFEGNKYIGYWHNGRIENFSSYMIYFPEVKTGIAIFLNALGFDGAKLGKDIMTAAFGGDITIPDFKVTELSIEQLEKFVGVYSSETHSLGIKILINDGKLFAQADGQGAFPLSALTEDSFEYPAAGITIKFDAPENMFSIKQGGRADVFVETSSEDMPSVVVDNTILQNYIGTYASDNFPLDIVISVKDNKLFAQGTGQSPFPLTPVDEANFKFDLAGIKISFDSKNKQLTMIQGGNETVMTKQ